MGTALSTLTSLESLELEFRSPRSPTQADRALTSLQFTGDSEYLEDIVSRLETPLLSYTEITFFNQLIFDTPLLRHFISRTEIVRAAYQGYVSCHPNNTMYYSAIIRETGRNFER